MELSSHLSTDIQRFNMNYDDKTSANVPPLRAVDWVTSKGFGRYEDDNDSDWNCCSWFEYLVTVVLSTLLLVGALVLALFWIMFYRGGFAWSENVELQFNLHPILMIAGFITFSGFSILLYRLCRCLKHIYVKLIHMLFHAIAIPCIALGFLAVFESHSLSDPPKQHFYSLHSWLGCITMGMFVLQFVVGFFSFLILLCCENRTYSFRSVMVPIHANFGLANFMLAIATAITGLMEKERNILKEVSPNETKSDMEHYIINALGTVLVALGILVCVVVRRSNAPATAKVYVTERL